MAELTLQALPSMRGRAAPGPAWTETRVKVLKEMWADGSSAGVIAKELGGITRSSVIGKVHRLGLPGRIRAPKDKPKRQTTKVVSRKHNNNYEFVVHEIETDIFENCDDMDNAIPLEQRRTLLELTDDTCKWPVGVPGEFGFFFCGAATKAASPYCSHHHSRAYTGMPGMRRWWI